MASNTSVAAGPTPLTLPNVIHFLQNESSRYERDRNYWELERAEMKARIAKLEGERKSSERMKDWYLRRLRMLEIALQEERLRSDPDAKPLPSVVDEEHSEKKSRSLRKGRIEHDDAYLELIRSSQAGLRAQDGRNKSRAYLEKCLTEVTYLVNSHPSITANKPVVPESFEKISEAPPNPIPGPRPMREQAPNNPDLPQRQASPAPMVTTYFDEPNSTTNGVHQVQGRQAIDELENSMDMTSGDEPVVKIQHTYDAQGNFIEPLNSAAMSTSGTITVEPDISADATSKTGENDWDFDGDSSSEYKSPTASKLKKTAFSRTMPLTPVAISVLRKSKHTWIATVAESMILLYKNEEAEPVLRLCGHEGAIHCLLFDSTQNDTSVALYSAGTDMVIRRWDLELDALVKYTENTKPSVTFISHSQPINALALVDGVLISCSADASVRRWDTSSGDSKRVWRIPGPATGVYPTSLCDLSSGNFATGYTDGSIKLYNINNDKATMSLFDGKLTEKSSAVVTMASIRFMNQSFMCIDLGEDGLRFYNVKSAEMLKAIPITGSSGTTSGLCALTTESQFVVGTRDGRMKIYSYRGDQVQELDLSEEGKDAKVTCLASSPPTDTTSACVVVGDSRGRIHSYCIAREQE